MFKKLHIKLTLICTLITSVILVSSSILINFYLEKQQYKTEYSKFETSCTSIYNYLKSEKVITCSYIADVYDNNGINVYIEQNGTPLLHDSLNLNYDTFELSRSAYATAFDNYNLDVSDTYDKINDYKSVNFKTKDNLGKRYFVSCGIVPTKSNNNVTVVLIYTLDKFNHKKSRQRLLFIFVDTLAIISLSIFSNLFTKHTLKPIDESQKRQKHFIAAASHELRSPLAVIISSSQALNKSSEEDRDKFLHNITSESNRMATLVNDMLQLANANNNTLIMNFDLENIDTILIDVYEMFEYISKKEGINLTIDLPDYEIPKVKCDKQRIIQVLSILINNAFNYCNINGKITLRIRYSLKTVKIFIIDTGSGISDEDKKHIFEPFYRADRSHNNKEHFGLGLSIAYDIISLHKGKLSVSDTEGGGTTFCISLGA